MSRFSIVRLATSILTGCAALYLPAVSAMAQPAPLNGPKPTDEQWHALVGATVVPSPGESIENATIVIRGGMIISVVPNAAPPEGARVWDATGLTIYPGLIDAHVPVSAPRPDPKLEGTHWNEKVTPQRSALDGPGVSDKDRKALRELGFTACAIAPEGGIFRGTGAVVLLSDPDESPGAERREALASRVFDEVSLERNRFGSDQYPGSEMGAIALIRQTLSDAKWRATSVAAHERSGASMPLPAADALDALAPATDTLPILFDTTSELQALRVAKIAREFGRSAMLLGSGTEFRRLRPIIEDGLPIILPLDFPKAPSVESEAEAEAVDLRTLMTWEQAPTNARRLVHAGATVALTSDKLRNRGDFAENLRAAIKQGLTEDEALTALTITPATLLGVADRVGTIEAGKVANLIVADGPLFEKDTKIRDLWIAGRRHEMSKPEDKTLAGVWDVIFGEADGAIDGTLTIDDDNAITIKIEENEVKARSVRMDGPRVSFLADGDKFDYPGVFTLSGALRGDVIAGVFVDPDGDRNPWSARRAKAPAADDADADDAKAGDDDTDGDDKDADDAEDDAKDLAPEPLVTPLGAYGLAEEREAAPRTIAVTGATLWTAGPDGIIEDATLLVSDGKVVYSGPSAGAPRLAADLTIDAAGKHVTPGLIDCHSHTGISGGVNEGTQAVTSEVRIFDVIDPDDIAFYRELAGGLTCCNQLHGSANPIGGQNSVVKLRWGAERPDDLRFEGAIPGIKFALGENVKQSNWGDDKKTRYPQTRMGVETIIRDRFIAAQEYAQAMAAYESLGSSARARTQPPRRDLELEALVEILAGERLIHCHSYRQDEILMLCRVAKDFGFTIGTFQHVLEGYKVAEAIRESAIGGSTFSDWWAYKFEVVDAIPFNGAIMHDEGIPVSFNSDSDELARRLNTEAGKAIKYGGLAPEEAIKFVTLNPAIQLKIDGRVGSLEAGKDADFVVWSGDPLSTLSRCESTWIDGVERFSLESDARLRADAQRERARILQKLLAKKDKGGKKGRGRGGPPGGRDMVDTPPTQAELDYQSWAFEVLRSGGSLDDHRCGQCGDFLDLTLYMTGH
ncbi:MAG: amidohydrolase family protein [Phycisphaeraceae bacterium]|nr:amidohydrolase family protein [Phycisphaeraceae bacterium]MCB9847824.1 amidohydrolase family protein [Phycisphaeraceae bacterium]